MLGRSFNLFLVLSIVINYQTVLCDESNNQYEPRIVGGSVADINRTKHQVSLRFKANEQAYGYGYGHLCGGSLISNDTILTAAHCVTDDNGKAYKASDYIIVAGMINRMIKDSNTIERTVSKIVVHKSYKPKTFENDIALMFLNETVPANHPTVQPIQLATSAYVVGTNCSVTGWGTTSYGGSSSAQLLTVDVLVSNTATCNANYGGSVKSGMFCAGVPGGGKDACQGDSGGPFVCNGRLTGVVSNGAECALANYPGIYADVYYYRDWIARGSANSMHLTSGLAVVVLFSLFKTLFEL